MPTPNEKLADALERLRDAEENGILRHDALSRTDRERLSRSGFIREIIKGWYRVSSPDEQHGETAWFPFYWEFVRQYLILRTGGDYCISAEGSIQIHSDSTTIPQQLVVMTRASGTQTLSLPGGLSIFQYREEKHYPDRIVVRGLNVMKLPEALVRAQESFFCTRPSEAMIALRLVMDASDLLRTLLEQGRSTVAGRLAGAFRANHQRVMADEILAAMQGAGYDVRETNPFERPIPQILAGRQASPYEIRVRSMWMQMREPVLKSFPVAPGLPVSVEEYMRSVDEQYSNDAYNSLSIEGYRVTPEMIDRVRGGRWSPDGNLADRQSRDAMAARGYYEAFLSVRQSVDDMVRGGSAGLVRTAHRDWYRALFAPSVQAGLLKASDLAGYRNHRVFISGSQHVPLSSEGLVDAMDTFFNLLEEEPEAAVRSILGHFIFVFIHPYGDGNGRLGRFLMNTMLASGGYPWTVIRLQNRPQYMRSLESASVGGDIVPFTEFVASEMQAR